MLRSSIYSAGVVLLGATAFAQAPLTQRPRPINAPVKYAGVYHLGTGTWTHGTQGSASLVGGGIIYDNTCSTNFYGVSIDQRVCIDEGRLPSLSSPVLANANGLGNDSEVGTQNSYTVDGFNMGWCAFGTAPVSYRFKFYEAYDACTTPTTAPVANFDVTGLPANGCWTADVDLCAASASFSMQADADGTYTTGNLGDTFGWSFELLTVPTVVNGDGFLIAGGRINLGSPGFCDAANVNSASGSDGTIFDTGTASPNFPDNQDGVVLGCGSVTAGLYPEDGSGMGSQDKFRYEGGASPAPGCYFFGGTNNPTGSWHLQLYSANVTLPSNTLTQFCVPGSGGVVACPCNNPPAGNSGCDNEWFTGGASISASGVASVSADTLVVSTAGQGDVTSIFWQGTQDISGTGGVALGQGVRCVGGNLLRLYGAGGGLLGVGGSVTVPPPANPSMSAKSALLGDPLAPGMIRYYFVAYRDPSVSPPCAANATFNYSSAGAVTWN